MQTSKKKNLMIYDTSNILTNKKNHERTKQQQYKEIANNNKYIWEFQSEIIVIIRNIARTSNHLECLFEK